MRKVKALGGEWTDKRIAKLKRLRDDTIHRKQTSFTFENQDIDTQFAKYLIEYVESELEKQ